MAPRRNTQPSPVEQLPSADSQPGKRTRRTRMQHPHAGPTSEEEFDLDVPDEDDYEQEHDVPPVRSNPVTENRTEPVTPINDPNAYGRSIKKVSPYEFFFGKKDTSSTEKRMCTQCTYVFSPFLTSRLEPDKRLQKAWCSLDFEHGNRVCAVNCQWQPPIPHQGPPQRRLAC